MSTTTTFGVGGSPADLEWIPSSVYRLTVSQYEAMIESGALSKRDKIHLINGVLVAKMTDKPRHATAYSAAIAKLGAILTVGWYLRPDLPIRISDVSMPEPDIVIARGTYQDYASRHPEPADIALIVEVAKSSLAEDRKMAGIYDRAGIPVYWLMDTVNRQIEVYSQPGPDGYAAMEVLAPGHVLTIVLDGVEAGEIAVEHIMP
jgi:Uma2 family endonuclease